MQRSITATIMGLTLALGACSSEAEETPDITEAIPLDLDQEGEASVGTGESSIADGVELSADAAGRDTPALPGASGEESNGGVTTGERRLPDTMETGSNPPDFEPPEGSKVQRFN